MKYWVKYAVVKLTEIKAMNQHAKSRHQKYGGDGETLIRKEKSMHARIGMRVMRGPGKSGGLVRVILIECLLRIKEISTSKSIPKWHEMESSSVLPAIAIQPLNKIGGHRAGDRLW